MLKVKITVIRTSEDPLKCEPWTSSSNEIIKEKNVIRFQHIFSGKIIPTVSPFLVPFFIISFKRPYQYTLNNEEIRHEIDIEFCELLDKPDVVVVLKPMVADNNAESKLFTISEDSEEETNSRPSYKEDAELVKNIRERAGKVPVLFPLKEVFTGNFGYELTIIEKAIQTATKQPTLLLV